MSANDSDWDYNLEEDFPNLRVYGWEKTSEPTRECNCISYAANDQCRPWAPFKGYYWPPGAIREDTLEGWADAYKVLNYKPCDDQSLEIGFEKIAIYAKDDNPTHVARQLESGIWTSKLGNNEDISHYNIEGLEGDLYGKAVIIMKRLRWVGSKANETVETPSIQN